MLSDSLAALDLEASAPPSFCCPIGRELMRDPVSCADGHSYEREHITRWLSESLLSPVTGAPLPSPDLRPNHALRNAIEEWAAQQQPSPPPEPEAPAVPPPSMLKRDLGSATAQLTTPGPLGRTPGCAPHWGLAAEPLRVQWEPGHEPRLPPRRSPPELEVGAAVIYTRSEDGAAEGARVQGVHREAAGPPYYTIRLLASGDERQTEASRLRTPRDCEAERRLFAGE